jgi:hypothetical protein
MSLSSLPRSLQVAALAGGLAVVALTDTARADEPHFGPYDVPTVFFISKSDDHNRVDYGIRLNAQCAPVNDDAVFPYWREFEHSPPVRTHALGFFEYVPYGFSEQRMIRRTQTSGEHLVRLKQLDRPIVILSKKEADGKCSAAAYARIGGVDGAQLVSVYAKLAGPMSVDYIDIHGKNPTTGADILERVRR